MVMRRLLSVATAMVVLGLPFASSASAAKPVIVAGQVLEMIPGTHDLQIYVNSQENSAVIVLRPSMKVPPKGTFVVAYGVRDGNFTGKNALGATLTYPQYAATHLKATNFLGYFAAGGKVYRPAAEWSQGGVTARVKEVVANASKGTLLVLVISNQSSSAVNVDSDQATVVAKASGAEVQATTDLLEPSNLSSIQPGAVVTQLAEFTFYPKGGVYSVNVPAFGGDIPDSGLEFTLNLPK